MPSATFAAAFFAGLLEKDRRLLNDLKLQTLYLLDPNPLDGKIKHLTDIESEALRALAAAAEPDLGILLDANLTRSRLRDNAHTSGRAALAKWFKKARFLNKIHPLIEEVLEASNAHPRQLLEELGDEVPPTALPAEDIIHSDIELGVANAVFGPNVLSAARLTSTQVKIIKILMHHVWNRLRKSRQHMFKTMSKRKAAWLEAERGTPKAITLDTLLIRQSHQK